MPPQGKMPGWQMILKREGPRLLQQAGEGRDPGLVANMALEYAPAQVKPHLQGFFNQDPDAIYAKMIANIPGLAEHQEWTEEFIYEARVLLGFEVESDDDDDLDDGGSGDDITGSTGGGSGEGGGAGGP